MDTDFARFVIVRNTFREYMQSCSEFWKAFQRCTIAIKSSEHQRQVLQTHLRLQTLWLEQRRLRFEYLLRGRTFGTGFWGEAIFHSWDKFPTHSITDNTGPGEDWLVKQYLQQHQQF
jgi:hypothetical protein